MGETNDTILTALVYGYTICVMLGLGASINLDIREEVRKAPKPILCGIASQYYRGAVILEAFRRRFLDERRAETTRCRLVQC